MNALAFNGTVTTSGLTVNSLLFNTNSQTLNGSGALTVNSGAVASVATLDVISGFSSLVLGNGEGVITSTSGSLTINTPVNGTANGGLTKTGGGTVVLGASNLYTGQTTVNQGTLQIGTSTEGDLGNNTANIVLNGGGLSFGRTNSGLTLSNTISGSGSVTQNGTGTTVLSGENTYTGTTTVSAGTLTLTGNRTVNTTGGYTVTGNGTQTLNIQNGNYGIGGTFVLGQLGGNSTVNHSAGTIGILGNNSLIMGNGRSTSFYNLSGGSLSTSSIIMGTNAGSVGNIATSTIGVSGGNLTATTLRIGRYDTAGQFYTTNTFTQTAGISNITYLGLGGNTTNAGNSTGPIIANLNLTGGNFTATNFASLSAGGNTTSSTNADSSTINIGGTAQVTLGAFPTARGTNSTANITFDTTTGGGGFLAPVAASATYMPANTFTNAFLTANGANFNVVGGKDITIGQALQNASGAAGALTKIGNGNLTLSGNNTYTGVTTLRAGTLSVATIGNGGVAGNLGQATSNATNLVFDGGGLSYTGGNASSDRNFTLKDAAVNSIGVTNAASTLTLTGTALTTTGVLQKGGAGSLTLDPGAGSYSLGSLNAGLGTLTLKSGNFTTTLNDPGTDHTMSAGARGGSLTVDGAALTVGGFTRFVIGAQGLDGTGNLISGSINANEVAIGHNASATMTQSGGTLTTTNLYHQDAGNATYTLTGGTLKTQSIFNNTANTQTFTLNLNGGTLEARAGTTNLIRTENTGTQISVLLGTGNTQIDTSLSNATIARPMGDMSGQAGRLTKIGNNTLTLSADNTYTGLTTVSAGTLRINGANSGNGAVIVAAGTTLGGSGSVIGGINVSGVLSPGGSETSIESFRGGALSFDSTSTYAYQLQTLGLNVDGDLAHSTSDLNIATGAILTLTDISTSTVRSNGDKLTLISYMGAGAWNGELFSYNSNTLANGSEITLGANKWMFKYDDTDAGSNFGSDTTGASRFVTMTVVPEPSVAVLLGGICTMLMLRRRRA